MKRRDWHFGDLANHHRQAWSKASIFETKGLRWRRAIFLRVRAKKSSDEHHNPAETRPRHPYKKPDLASRVVELITLDPRSRFDNVTESPSPIQEMHDKWGPCCVRGIGCKSAVVFAGPAARRPQAFPYQTAALSTVVPNAIQ